MHTKYILLSFLICFFLGACSSQKDESTQLNKSILKLNTADLVLAQEVELDTSVLIELRKHNLAPLTKFSYSFSQKVNDSTQLNINASDLKGVIFEEESNQSIQLIYLLKDYCLNQGYTIFILEDNYATKKDKDKLAIVNTDDPYKILKQVHTNALELNISNDSLLNIVKKWNDSYDLQLIAAAQHACEFTMKKKNTSWLQLAQEVQNIAPDVIKHGAGSVEELAKEMQAAQRIYLWWD